MIFAAGLGTRLGEVTRDRPKALVEVGGVPILERVARRLIEAGATRIVINVHHHAEQIIEYVQGRSSFGIEIVFSVEPDEPLETGGGLVAARHLLSAAGPILLHNADILTDAPLREMYAAHQERRPLVTLAVMERPSTRQLLFDDLGLLGRTDRRKDLRFECRTPRGPVRAMGFAGIHIIDAALPARIEEEGVFSILDPYLRLAGGGESILPFDIGGSRWIDIGKPEQLQEAREWLEHPLRPF